MTPLNSNIHARKTLGSAGLANLPGGRTGTLVFLSGSLPAVLFASLTRTHTTQMHHACALFLSSFVTSHLVLVLLLILESGHMQIPRRSIFLPICILS